jgi:hypothetical protein
VVRQSTVGRAEDISFLDTFTIGVGEQWLIRQYHVSRVSDEH